MSKPLVPDSIIPFTSLQQVFNRAWEWSRTRGQCTAMVNGMLQCCYRDFGGNACLIGACIPDSFEEVLKTKGHLHTLFRIYPTEILKIFPFLGTQSSELSGTLMKLQACHDRVPPNESYLEGVTKNLIVFAQTHGLTIPS